MLGEQTNCDIEPRQPHPEGAFERDQSCRLCGERVVLRVREQDRRGRPLSTVICVSCGLISHERVPSKLELDEYYAKEYRRDYHGQPEPSPFRVIREWRRSRDQYRQLSRFLRKGDRVFDIGAGLGCAVKAFQMAGYEASGIEPGNSFREFARSRLGVKLSSNTLDTLPRLPEYDFILLKHVIEHLRDPLESLRHIHQMLRSGGRLFISCPNAGAPHALPGKMFHYAHIFNFTHDTLIAMAEAAGFVLCEQLSVEAETNLMLVLERADRERVRIRPGSFARAYEVITGTSPMKYYARPSYLLARCRTIFALPGDRFLAHRRLASIIAQSQQPHGRAAA